MLDFFAGVPGKLKALTDRLTSVRAGYLDNLNTNLAVLPAPASTAVSNAYYTNARGPYLDNINKTPLLDVPIASGLPAPSTLVLSGYVNAKVGGVTFVSTASATYVDVLDYTGQGFITFLVGQTASAQIATVKLIIDAATIGEFATTATGYSCVPIVGLLSMDGSANVNGIASWKLPFKTSIKIQHKVAGGGSSTTFYQVCKTA